MERGVEGDEKDTPCRKAADEFAFLFDGDRRIESGKPPRGDDRIEDRHNVLGVLNPDIANVD
jgi:hypothetical protein